MDAVFLGSVYATAELDPSKFQAGAKAVKGALSDVGDSATTASKGFLGSIGNMGSALADMAHAAVPTAIGITTSFALIAKSAIGAASEMEQSRVAFTTMLGSAEAAGKLIQSITETAKTTPFTVPDLVASTKQLLAFGIDADKLIPTVRMLGDVASGTGVPIQQLAFVFGQVRTAGHLVGNDLRQFINAGVPLVEILSKQLKVSQGDIQDMVSKGKISFADVEKAFSGMTSKGGKFFNMMDAQSHTFAGVTSNVADSIGILLRSAVGLDATGAVRKGSIFAMLEDAVTQLQAGIDAVTPTVVAFINGIVSNKAALAGVLGVMVGIATIALLPIIAAVAAAIPGLLIFSAAGAAIAVVGKLLIDRLGGVSKIMDDIKGAANTAGPILASTFDTIKNALQSVYDLVVKGDFTGMFNKIFHVNEDSQIVDIILKVRDTFIGLTKSIGKSLQDLGPPLQELWKTIQPLLIPALKIVGVILGVVIVGSILALLAVIKILVIGIKVIIDNINQFVSTVKGIYTEIVALPGQVQGVFDKIGKAITDAFDSAKKSVKDGLKAISDYLDATNRNITNAFNSGLKSVQDAMTSLVGFINDAINTAVYIFNNFPYLLGFAIGSAAKSIFDGASAIHDAVIYWFTTTVDGAIALWKSLVDRTIAFFSALPGQIAAIAQAVWLSVTSWFTQTSTDITVTTQAGLNAVVTFFTALPGQLSALVQQVWAAITGWFGKTRDDTTAIAKNTTDNVISFYANLPAKIAGFAGMLYNSTLNLASNIKQGLIDGITAIPSIVQGVITNMGKAISDAAKGLYDKMKNVAANIWQGFKDGLGIHSPSYIERAMYSIMDESGNMLQTVTSDVRKLANVIPTALDISPIQTALTPVQANMATGAIASPSLAQTAPVTNNYIDVKPGVFAGTPTELRTVARRINNALLEDKRASGASL